MKTTDHEDEHRPTPLDRVFSAVVSFLAGVGFITFAFVLGYWSTK